MAGPAETTQSVEELQALVYDYLQFYRGLQCQVWQEGSFVEVDYVGRVNYSELLSSPEPFTKVQLGLPSDPHSVAQYLIFGTNEAEWDETCLGVEILKEFALPHIHGTRTVQYRLSRVYRRLSPLMKRRDAVVMSFMMWMHDNSFLILSRSVTDPAVPPSQLFVRMEVLWHSKHISQTSTGCSVEVILQENAGSALTTFASAANRRAVHKQSKVWYNALVTTQQRRGSATQMATAQSQQPIQQHQRQGQEEQPPTGPQLPAGRLTDQMERRLGLERHQGEMFTYDATSGELVIEYTEQAGADGEELTATAELTNESEWQGAVVFTPVSVVKWGINFAAYYIVTKQNGEQKAIYVPGVDTYDAAGKSGDSFSSERISAATAESLAALIGLQVFAASVGMSELQLDEIHACFSPVIEHHRRGTLARWISQQVVDVMLYGRDPPSYAEFIQGEVKDGVLDLSLAQHAHTREYLESFQAGRPVVPQQYYKTLGLL
eukprot:c2620_g1_i1.p1 GENE.c2620_g1_i1~~c2620_g1_i1.p1  ORF type:complete len:521 (+),score=123.13 c2620_g1_i1:92-1564(+)